MESTSVNPDSQVDSRLELLLRTGVQPAPPDDGFAHRVLAALPPSPRRRMVQRRVFGSAGAVVGSAFALLDGATWEGLAQGLAATSRQD